jgi:DNA polymerase-3 subunit delta
VPALDIDALRKHIKDRKLAPVYVFVGEDIKLVERMVDAVEATIDEADRAFATERVYAGEAGGLPIDIAAAARVFPMLGDRRLVVVLRAERLLKPKRASKAADDDAEDGQAEEEGGVDFTPLEDYLAAPVPSTSLVFVATEIDRTRRFTKRLVERAQVVAFSGIGGAPTAAAQREGRAKALDLVRDELTRAGRTMDPAAINLLVDRAGGDISKLRGDLERLLLYTEGQKKIGRDDVADIAAVETQDDPWGVVNAIADGDTARALLQAAQRLDRGDSPHALVGQLRWWVSSRLVEADPSRVPPAIDALLRTDLALKSSGGDERVLVERLVVELTGRPLARR